MLLTIVLAIFVIVVFLAVLSLIGRAALGREMVQNDSDFGAVRDFHQQLVRYANSNGQDQSAFQYLAMNSPSVEAVIGWDNIVSGVRVGMYTLSGAPILPFAVHEMRREFGDGLWGQRGGEIADSVQTVLFRHMGRREQSAVVLAKKAGSFGGCVSVGWTAISALPLTVLSVFGLLNRNKANRARESLIFRLWNLLLALVAIGGFVFAYLADREKIDQGLSAIFFP